MGLTKGDVLFWKLLAFLIFGIVFIFAILFLPLFETSICTPSGECSDTKILKSLFEILTGQ